VIFHIVTGVVPLYFSGTRPYEDQKGTLRRSFWRSNKNRVLARSETHAAEAVFSPVAALGLLVSTGGLIRFTSTMRGTVSSSF